MARARRTASTLILMAFMAAIGVLLAWVLYQQDQSADARTQQASEIEALSSAVSEANDRLQESGQEPVDVPRSSPGERGEQGDQGEQGERGEPGEPGPRGSAGPAGEVGPKGDTGAAGPAGKNGAAGKDGSTGVAGEPGPQGEPGAQGPAGPAGPAGPEGPAGQPGATGPVGPAGPAGADGRGIDHIECGTDGRWLIYYTTDPMVGVPVEGPCRVIANPLG